MERDGVSISAKQNTYKSSDDAQPLRDTLVAMSFLVCEDGSRAWWNQSNCKS
jgi:hypothetical protein